MHTNIEPESMAPLPEASLHPSLIIDGGEGSALALLEKGIHDANKAEKKIRVSQIALKECSPNYEKARKEVNDAIDSLKEAANALKIALEKIKEEEHRHHIIHFTLDGEPCETEKKEMTPNYMISEFGKQDPSNHYLIQLKGHHSISYKGKGDVPIKLHEGDCFQIITIGPTPVSDGRISKGAETFMQGLRDLGYTPEIASGTSDHIFFEYSVPEGIHLGKKVRLGFVVPSDFPMTTPSGPYVSPHIHSHHPENGLHPKCGVNNESGKRFEELVGGKWQYWSRPFPGWDKCKKTVMNYMGHILNLWGSQ